MVMTIEDTRSAPVTDYSERLGTGDQRNGEDLGRLQYSRCRAIQGYVTLR